MSGQKKKRQGKVLTFAVSTALLAAPALSACGGGQEGADEPGPMVNEPEPEHTANEIEPEPEHTVNEVEPEPEPEEMPSHPTNEPAPRGE